MDAKIRVVSDFVGDGGDGTVPRVDLRVRRQRSKYVHQAVDNLIIGSALKVGTSDTHTEESVATECHVFFFAVVGDTTRGMTWGMEDEPEV